MLNGRSYFLGALYHTRGGFSHLQNFVKKFSDRLNSLPFERKPVLEQVQLLLKEYTQVNVPIGEEEALKLMLAEDLRAVETILQDDFITRKIDARQQIDVELNNRRDEAVDLLRKLGVRLESPQVFVVDELPPPYIDRGYSAFTADEGDYETHGITPGLYFPKSDVIPFYSEFLLVHELIHTVLGKHSPYLIARGLEEGLAELIGSMFLSSKILGKEITTNLFIYNRLGYGFNQFWELYLDATRQATFLHQRFGLQSLLSILNEGRGRVKEVENFCLRMEFDKINLPYSEIDPELSKLSDYISLAFGRNFVVSPLAKYLTRFIHPGDKVTDILKKATVDVSAGKKSIYELQDRVLLLALSADQAEVTWSDCELYSEGPVLRYDISGSTKV
jgi:hypothetical protein